MFATAPSQCWYREQVFTTNIPSPLSPRSANVFGPHRAFMSQKRVEEKPTQSTETRRQGGEEKSASVPFGRRAAKKAPVGDIDAGKERRRRMFWKNVRHGREEKRFEAREEDMMRLDFVQQRKAWEAEQARTAPSLPSEPLEEDDEAVYEGMWSTSSSNVRLTGPAAQMQMSELSMPDEDLDDVLQRETRELEALLDLLPETDQMEASQKSIMEDQQSITFWSDDDDLEAFIMEAEGDNVPSVSAAHNGRDEMDTT